MFLCVHAILVCCFAIIQYILYNDTMFHDFTYNAIKCNLNTDKADIPNTTNIV